MTQRIHNENADWLAQIYADLPHHERTWALTGKLNDDGITVNPNTTDGLPVRYMWVRTEGVRTGSRALIGGGMFAHFRRADRRIYVGYNDVGEFVAIEPVTDGITAAMEGNDPYNDTGGGSGVPVPVSLLVGLRLLPPRDAHASGLWVFLEADPTLGWLGGDVEVTSGEPANPGEFGWTVVYFNATTGVPGIYTHTAEVKPNKEALTFDADTLIAALPAGVYPAGAVSLYESQTEVTGSNSRFEDLRRFVNATNATTVIGTVSLSDGAVGTPSLFFTADTNTGIYRIGTDQMGFTAGGVKVADVLLTSGQRTFTFGDGTDAAIMRWGGAAGEVRDLRFYSGTPGVGANGRWFVRINATAEGGSNAGSNFAIQALSDAGAVLTNSFGIIRSSGHIVIGTAPENGLARLHVVDGAGGTTTTVLNTLMLTHNVAGTPGAGFGGGILMSLESSTTNETSAARLRFEWTTATHASRKARGTLSAFDTAERDCIQWEASGTVPMVGFLGTAPIVKPAALTTQLTTITHTAPGTPDYAIQNLTNAGGFGFVTADEGNTLLSVVANLQTRMAQFESRVQSLGLLT